VWSMVKPSSIVLKDPGATRFHKFITISIPELGKERLHPI
jgi:hypothetical protein